MSVGVGILLPFVSAIFANWVFYLYFIIIIGEQAEQVRHSQG